MVAILTSCVSYQRVAAPEEAAADTPLPKAYISNAADYRTEYKILRYANRYHLVADSAQADTRLELQPLQPIAVGCVTPQFAVSLFSLGFYTVEFLEGYVFAYSEVGKEERIDYREQVNLTKRRSWFHLFSLRKSRKKAIGQSLHPRAAARPILLSH